MTTPTATDWLHAPCVSHPAVPPSSAHTLHTYFVTSPESPDGQWVLYFRSTSADAHTGAVCIYHRHTGEERVLAPRVESEDAHRQACQQWVAGGQRVVYHSCHEGPWRVYAADPATGAITVLAEHCLLGWGQPHSPLIPLYGMHWDTTSLHDIELLDVLTGKRRTALTATALREAYPEWVARIYGERPLSLFFPILNPTLGRVLIKIAAPTGGHFRSPQASLRHGFFIYDLAARRFTVQRHDWGHPAWHPAGDTLINVPNVVIDAATGAETPLPLVPRFPGSHPAWHPTAPLYVTDTKATAFGGPAGHWGLAIVRADGLAWRLLETFDFSGGPTSWRPAHPHPHFSADGARLYSNQVAGGRAQLTVTTLTA